MQKELKHHIEYLLCIQLERVSPMSGGDISQAYLLESENERFFCKINHGVQALNMFRAEKAGLEAIRQTKTIATPKVIICETLGKGGFLIMEYVEPKRPSSKEMKLLGHQLAALHQFGEWDTFGWKLDNFIGSLPQSNQEHPNWAKFYVRERLLPQLRMAVNNGRMGLGEVPNEETLLRVCTSLFPEATPALLHGDLWSGNYLISTDGTPYLIDPATYYGHQEVDLAMTRLFGGFDSNFYEAYGESFPKRSGETERTDIYQLYYLLVHLNLFGRSYYPSVRSIIKRYF